MILAFSACAQCGRLAVGSHSVPECPPPPRASIDVRSCIQVQEPSRPDEAERVGLISDVAKPYLWPQEVDFVLRSYILVISAIL